jgi:polyferredoxin
MILLMFGLVFAGGEFCSFCPAIVISPVLAGMKVSIYLSGFMMVIVLVGSFFKRRFWCNICPLGYLIGLAHRISPFRVKKDTVSCTECGACYEACPMGIKMIYTEREKADVTDINCIMCGECVRSCPEDNALALAFAGKKFYMSSRAGVMSGFGGDPEDSEDKK